MVRSPAAPDSFAVIFRFGATMELGRSERPTMRPLWSYGVDGADSPDRMRRWLGRRRALSPTFPAGELVFFIPWRVVAENPARRSKHCGLTRTRRLGGAAA